MEDDNASFQIEEDGSLIILSRESAETLDTSLDDDTHLILQQILSRTQENFSLIENTNRILQLIMEERQQVTGTNLNTSGVQNSSGNIWRAAKYFGRSIVVSVITGLCLATVLALTHESSRFQEKVQSKTGVEKLYIDITPGKSQTSNTLYKSFQKRGVSITVLHFEHPRTEEILQAEEHITVNFYTPFGFSRNGTEQQSQKLENSLSVRWNNTYVMEVQTDTKKQNKISLSCQEKMELEKQNNGIKAKEFSQDVDMDPLKNKETKGKTNPAKANTSSVKTDLSKADRSNAKTIPTKADTSNVQTSFAKADTSSKKTKSGKADRNKVVTKPAVLNTKQVKTKATTETNEAKSPLKQSSATKLTGRKQKSLLGKSQSSLTYKNSKSKYGTRSKVHKTSRL